ncbi:MULTISPECIES: 30S ribosomal protein S16 [unclassified Brevibacterium]|uniref:30S ribosomal protein S16 n=1 Tax=unclassified Brevibacterium TaxID=2614124 RepID=UPI0010C7D309|nr:MULTISPECIES: 30S ribosomal protein S16 [Actinomycetes]MCK1802025.1 30S ribosomal protein S16 [Brevibacterium sp. R8603A2]MCX0278370.1 30S ribosomal protein S16 [Nocardia zapadnayensis]QCP06213.1 30S ribosomal protein S16 [Brevibacterium sp. CS2]
MAVKIRLTRLGKVHAPFYRVVVADSRTRRDGKTIEDIGKYHPLEEPSLVEIDSERALYWLSVGAQPTDQVRALLKLTGDWQKFTGEGEAVSTVKPQQEKAAFEAPATGSVIKEATTPKGGDKAEEPAAEAPAEEPAAAESTDEEKAEA